ncbi:MAG: cell division protein FtsQ/DivIB [Saprospiraceae bacterium]
MNKNDLNITLKRASWLVALFIAIAIVLSAVQQRESSLVEGVAVDIAPLQGGNTLIKPEDVKLTIERTFGTPIEGLPLSQIDVERIEEVLEEDPFVVNADAYVDSRSRVNVKIAQREPMLRIIDNNGLNYYLDADGNKMPLSKHFAARVLVATGNLPPHDPLYFKPDSDRKNRLRDVFDLSHHLLADSFFKALIEQIYVSNTGEFTLIPKVGDQKILFGHYNNVNEKLENLKIFYQEGMPYEGWQKYRTINLKYKGQVVCEKR